MFKNRRFALLLTLTLIFIMSSTLQIIALGVQQTANLYIGTHNNAVNFTGTFGTKVRVSNSIVVKGINFPMYIATGVNETVRLGIWDGTTNTLIMSKDIAMPQNYSPFTVNATIPATVLLPNKDYYIGIYQVTTNNYIAMRQVREVFTTTDSEGTSIQVETSLCSSGLPSFSIPNVTRPEDSEISMYFQLVYNNNQTPTANITKTTGNVYSAIAGFNKIIITGNMQDLDSGDTVTLKYNFDSGVSRNITSYVSTGSVRALNNTEIDVSTLTEGNHNFNIWAEDQYGVKSSITTIPFNIDKTAPVINSLETSSTATSITLTGSATDAVAGLSTYPYRYKIGTNAYSTWIATPYTQNSLVPNTQYSAIVEARDAVGHVITSTTKIIHTKSAVPSLTVNNATPYSIIVSLLDNNPSTTQYQISVNNGTQYITPEGTLTTSPIWITLPNKNITITGLNPSTTYTFTAKAKNAEGVETALSAPVSGTTLVQPPSAPVNMTAVSTSNSISLVWDPVAGSTGYDIEVDGNIIDNSTYTSYNHTGLTPYTQHTYRVRAKNEGGAGAWSEPLSKYTQQDTPNTPFNIDTAATNTSIIVTWKPIPGATAYDIEVDGMVVNNGSSTNFVHNGLLSGTIHSYRVRSINSGGKSDWSNEVLVSTMTDVPTVPENIVALASGDTVTVIWDEIPGATYEIEVDGNVKDNGTSTNYVHTGLQAGTEHSYRVRTKKSGSTSDWSTLVTAALPIDEFGIPKNIKAEVSDTSVALSWSPVVDAIGYEVEVDGVALDNGTETACVLSSLIPNTQYTYRVRAKGMDKVSDWSEAIAITTYALPTPKNITAIATGDIISLTWNAVEGAESYELDIDGQLIEGLTTNSYTHEGLTPNSQHSYRVRAKNVNGTSNWSTIVNETLVTNALNVPTGIIAKSMTNSIQLIWKPMPDGTTFDIEVDGTEIQNVATANYLNNGLIPGTQHSYRIRAVKDNIQGNWSNPTIVSTLADAPAIPTNITTSSTMTSILITWDKVDNATEYEIVVDGVTINAGLNNKYMHNNLAPDTTHTYKLRAKSAVAESPWSEIITANTNSSVQTYDLQSTNGQVFNLTLMANDITDPTKYTYSITYNPDELELIDLCAITSRIDLDTGNLVGTDIQVVQFTSGTIVFKKLGNSTGQAWTGYINSIKFKSKKDGISQIIYSIQ